MKPKEVYFCPKDINELILVNVSYGSSIENDVQTKKFRCPEVNCGYTREVKEE